MSLPRLIVVAALAAALLERWPAVQPVLWALTASLVPSLLIAARRLGTVRLSVPLLLFCLWVPLSLTWNDDPEYSYRSILTFLALIILALWLVVWETPTSALGLLAAAAALTAIAGVLLGILYPNLIPQINPGSFQGLYTHKNWLALAMGYLFLAGIHLKSPYRLLRWVTILGSATLLVLAQSTGAFVALAVTIAVLSGRSWLKRWISPTYRRIIGLMTLAAVVALVIGSLRYAYAIAVGWGEGRDIDRRFQLWAVTSNYAIERPIFGWGWRGSWSNSRGVTGDIVRDMGGFQAHGAHSGYIDIFLQGGIVAFVLVTILLWRVIWPRLGDKSLLGWSALALFSAVFTVSDSFLNGHVPILVIVAGWLFGQNPQLWKQPHASSDLSHAKGKGGVGLRALLT